MRVEVPEEFWSDIVPFYAKPFFIIGWCFLDWGMKLSNLDSITTKHSRNGKN